MKLVRRILDCRPLMHGLFVVYLVVLLRITVFRPDALVPSPEFPPVNLHLADAYIGWVQRGLWRVVAIQLLGNLIWFAPFGGYLTWRMPRLPLWGVALSGLGFSLAIEVGQYLLSAGIADIDDLVLNTAGALLGALVMGAIIEFVNEDIEP